MNSVEIETGARLHFGLLCTGAGNRGHFAGVGLMVRRPGWTLQLTRSGNDDCHVRCDDAETEDANSEVRRRVHNALELTQTSEDDPAAGCGVVVRRSIPLHCGFGAGTQLALAVASGVALLTRRGRIAAEDAADVCGRAQRSGIGTRGFETGGFLVDAGVPAADDSEPRLRHLSIPDNWRFVIVRHRGRRGRCGPAEASVFARDLRLSDSEFATLWSLIDDQLRPAVQNAQFSVFATALGDYGQRVGEFFAAEQGGCYSDPQILPLSKRLQKAGLPQPVQSSWGPAVCIPAESASHADEIADCVAAATDQSDLVVDVTRPLNHGATLRTIAPEQNPHRSFG